MDKILFFLIPLPKVVFVYDDFTLEKVFDTMKTDRFTAIPILDRNGQYVGTLSEGDILWHLKSLNFKNLDKVKVTDIPRHRDNEPVKSDANIETLIARASSENFVPVLDADDKFIGIITRKEIINYFFERKFVVL
jgi:CBS domain-containing protein